MTDDLPSFPGESQETDAIKEKKSQMNNIWDLVKHGMKMVSFLCMKDQSFSENEIIPIQAKYHS